jgi:Domain of unknown function (DUF222)
MSTLRSALDEFEREDLRVAADAAIEDDLHELTRAAARIDVERSRRLAEIERRGSFRRDGSLSITSWLIAHGDVAPGAAAQQVRIARFLRDLPAVAEALIAGELSPSAVAVLSSARSMDADAFARSETMLLDAARSLPIRQLTRAIAHWRQLVEADRDVDGRFEARTLHVSPTIGGMVRIDGDLDPETSLSLLSALSSVMDAWARGSGDDARTPAQRRVDAFGEVCRGFLDRCDRPTVAGERPHIVVNVRLDDLRGTRAGRAALAGMGPITGETARRLACDAGVSRVITRGRWNPSTWDGRPRRSPAAPTRDRDARPGLPVPPLRPLARLVRRAPHHALGTRWSHGAREPRPALPASPSPRARQVPCAGRGRPDLVHPSGRLDRRRSGAAWLIPITSDRGRRARVAAPPWGCAPARSYRLPRSAKRRSRCPRAPRRSRPRSTCPAPRRPCPAIGTDHRG